MDNIIYKIGNIKYLLVFSLLLFLTSCSAEIESASANSTSAILAVCGEYILAIFSLIVLLVYRPMAQIAVSKTVDVGSVPTPPAIKLSMLY